MKPDIKNVAITFSLVLITLTTSSILYARKIMVEELIGLRADKRLHEELIAQQEMQQLLIQKANLAVPIELVAQQPVATTPVKAITPVATKPNPVTPVAVKPSATAPTVTPVAPTPVSKPNTALADQIAAAKKKAAAAAPVAVQPSRVSAAS
ncbi:MAG: hypothetical protein RLZZ230_24 [Candidatus Parcubacteria bacterium]|jgi:hypothetical protein